MKLLVVTLLFAVAVAAPPASRTEDEPIPIVAFKNFQDPNGSGAYNFAFQTGNGISRSEQGSQRQITSESAGMVVQGKVEYIDEDGSKVTLEYVADENGFQPRGSHLPVAPPTPDHVTKMLEDLKRMGVL